MVRTDNKKGSKGCKPSGVNLYKKLVYGGVNQVNDNFFKFTYLVYEKIHKTQGFFNICKLCKPTLYSSKKNK